MKNILRIMICLLLFILTSNSAKSQHVVDSVPYCCNFENLMDQGFWILRNSSTGNKWVIGNATNNGGTYSLYISNDNGINNAMSASLTYSYAMRKLHLPAGMYEVSYDWKANGYYSTYYQYMRVFLIPVSATFSGGSLYSGLSATAIPGNAISLDDNTALLLHSNWTTYSNPLVQVNTTNDYYLVFFWYNYSYTVGNSAYQPPAAVDNICINRVTCPQPYNITTTNLGGNQTSVDWTDFGTPAPIGWIVEYGRLGFTPGTGTQAYTTTKPYTITGLQTNETYEIYVRAICDSTDTSNYSKGTKIRYCGPNASCIDFTDLHGTGVTCTYGTFTNYGNYSSSGTNVGPYANTGVIDYGSSRYGTSSLPGSRHTVHDDPSETDRYTNGQLYTVPDDACESVRLGCVYGSYICQSISYQMTVDTADADLLLLKYACVMYNPSGHPTSQQPRFQMEILDAQGNLISPTCGYADFNSAAAATTWNAGNASNVYWKDWTPVGISIATYHGQTIRVRLTSFSCGQGASEHFGYAYFTLNCQKARITSSNCGGQSTEATLTAPAGFNYRWYTSRNPNQTISTSRTVSVTLDSTMYYCEVSFIDAPSCKFTLSVLAIPRFPHSVFTTTIDTTGCQYKVLVTNQSYASISELDTIRLADCESWDWYWGDGTSDIGVENPRQHIYSQPGTYTIMLVASISDGTCNDTSYFTVTFNPPITPTIFGDSVVCTGTLARISVNLPSAVSYRWSNGETTSSINVYPTDSITYTVHVTDYIGCETDLRFHIDVDTVPLPTLEPSIYESCVPYSLAISDISSATNTNSYTWIWGDGSSTNNNNHPTHTYSEEGEYPLYCCIRSAEGCFDTISRMVYVYGFGHGSFSWNPPIITVTSPVANFINLTNHRSTNLYHWEFFNHDTYSGSSDDFEPSYTWTGGSSEFAGNNLVRLITTNQIRTHSGGTVACVDTVEAYVMIINDFLQFPNVITANGDGVNDIFEIKNLIGGGGYTDNELYIYNHWGRKVYYKKNITTKEDFWDPAANNEPSGTYYYRFAAKGYLGDIQRNGTIQVISK